MRDTSPEMGRLLRNKIMALSGEMRFIMGAQMFDSALELIKASLPKRLVRSGTAPAIVQAHLRQRT